MTTFTNGDFVSEIRNHLKALNKDDYVSARYILSTANSYIQYLINNRPLSIFFRDRNVFTKVDCVEMQRIKSYDCCVVEFKTCDKIMRSKKKLPKILKTKQGSAIQFVMNVVYGEEYQPLRNAADYNINKKREFGNNFKYYYIEDDYIYLLNSTSELISISAAFLEEDELNNLSSCNNKSEDSCKSKLENKFVCPADYLSTVRDQTLNIILNGNKQIQPDENPDMDIHQKTRTK